MLIQAGHFVKCEHCNHDIFNSDENGIDEQCSYCKFSIFLSPEELINEFFDININNMSDNKPKKYFTDEQLMKMDTGHVFLDDNNIDYFVVASPPDDIEPDEQYWKTAERTYITKEQFNFLRNYRIDDRTTIQ